MMNNFFWFLHRPNDEREERLIAAAQQRSLRAYWLMLVIMIGWLSSSDMSGSVSLSVSSLMLAVILFYMIGVLAGWATLQKEELSSAKHHAQPNVLKEIIKQVMLLGAYTLALILAPSWFLYLMALYIIVACVFFGMWAWKSIPEVAFALRLPLSIFFVPFAIAFGRNQKSLLRGIAEFIGFFLLETVVVIASFVISWQIVMPIYPATDAFAPELRKDQYALFDKHPSFIIAGDIVSFRDEHQQLILGKVISWDHDVLTVKTSDRVMQVQQNDILGRLVPLPILPPYITRFLDTK